MREAASHREGGWPRLHRRDARALCILAIVCFVAYLPSFIGMLLGWWPFTEDAVAQFAPWREYAKGALWQGILPLWNPHTFCGMPFMSNGQSAVFYPANIVYWLLPSRIALYFDALLHSFFLAAGYYFLARALRQSRTASWFVAVAMSLSGAVLGHIFAGHMSWHAASAYIPWLMWATLRYLQSGRRFFVGILLVLLWLQISSGHPVIVMQGVGLSVALLGAWCVTKLWQRRMSTQQTIRVLPQGWISTVAVFTALATLLGAVTILPLREISRWSVHGSGLTFDEVTLLSGTWKSWLRLLAPNFFGGNHGIQWSIIMGAHEEVAYVGIFAAVLALGAPLLAQTMLSDDAKRSLHPAVFWLWCLLPITAVLALGRNSPLYHWLYDYVVFFRLTRVPVRWLTVWSIAAALLAGFAYDACIHRASLNRFAQQNYRILQAVLVLIAVAFGAVALWAVLSAPDAKLWMDAARWSAMRAAKGQLEVAANFRLAAVLDSLTVVVLISMALVLLARWKRTPVSGRKRVELLLLGFVALDVMLLFWRSAKLTDAEWMQNRGLWPTSIAQLYQPGQRWDTAMEQTGINWNLPHRIDSFSGYDPVGGRDFYDFASAIEGYPFWEGLYQPHRRPPLLRVAGVTHTVVSKRQKDDVDVPYPDTKTMRLVRRDGRWELWQHKAPWPRVYLSRRALFIAEDQQLARLNSLAAQPFVSQGQPVVLAPDTRFNIGSGPLTDADKVISWKRNTNSVTVDYSATSPSVLVIGETAYPGWKVWVNGQPVEIAKANHMFRAVEVPAGHGRASVVFDSQTYRFALFLSLFGLMALAAGVQMFLVRRANSLHNNQS
jgi:hypothetical protein